MNCFYFRCVQKNFEVLIEKVLSMVIKGVLPPFHFIMLISRYGEYIILCPFPYSEISYNKGCLYKLPHWFLGHDFLLIVILGPATISTVYKFQG